MFGGFATTAWNLNPKWAGDDTCFLFTLTPKMRIFNSTGFNDHYQYLNLNQQTMPNGLVIFNFRTYVQRSKPFLFIGYGWAI